jgi:NADP-dependent 3-hydroxy acid dehydrogenase YdfG
VTRTILVTGDSSGIGAACARKFLSGGWQVGLLARRADRLEALAGAAPAAHALPADVTDPAAVERAVAALVAATGRLDVLFNNAGIFPAPALIDEIAPADWDAAVAVNLTGMVNAARAAFAQMRRQTPPGGRIINNGSVSAQSPRPRALAYTVTKHGVTGLTKQLALDGREFRIACGQIDIGNARTGVLEEIAARTLEEGASPPPTFDVDEVARAVWQMATLPAEANVLSMTLMATAMPLVGRG